MQDPVERRLTLGEHLEELRTRVIYSLLYIGAGLVLCFAEIQYLMPIVLGPYKWAAAHEHLADRTLMAIRPAEGFMTSLKVAFIGGCFLSSPFVLHQMWRFISAGLYPHERKAILTYLPLSIVLFLAGCTFGYFCMLPPALAFLIGYPDKADVEARLGFAYYLDFFLLLTLLAGLSFELPIVMAFFARIGIVSPDSYRTRRKYAFLGMFVIAAIFDPSPDPVSMPAFALLLYGLYEGGILLSAWRTKKTHEPQPGAPA